MARPSAPPCLSVSVVKFANVRKCPVLSGPTRNAALLTLNSLYNNELRQLSIVHQTGHARHSPCTDGQVSWNTRITLPSGRPWVKCSSCQPRGVIQAG